MKDQQKLDIEGVQQLVTELLDLNWFEKCGIKELYNSNSFPDC